MGSSSSYAAAERAITLAAKQGTWVLLKNAHLAKEWLVQLPKKLQTIGARGEVSTFRLFIALEIVPKLPVSLLVAGRKLVFERPPGVRAQLRRAISMIPKQRFMAAPKERSTVYFMLSWFHSVVQERLQYEQIGWSKQHEFGDADLMCGLDTIDTWLDATALGRQHLPPDKLPLDTIRRLFASCVYGGRIDNEFDQRLLNTFLDRFFTPQAFQPQYQLTEEIGPSAPDEYGHEQVAAWIEVLPDERPAWLGLANNAENVRNQLHGQQMMRKWAIVVKASDQADDFAFDFDLGSSLPGFRAPSDGLQVKALDRLKPLQLQCDAWLKELDKLEPAIIDGSEETTQDKDSQFANNPVVRVLQREHSLMTSLFHRVRNDCRSLVTTVRDQLKVSTAVHELAGCLLVLRLPPQWLRYVVPRQIRPVDWFRDFIRRLQQVIVFARAIQTTDLKAVLKLEVWLGGLCRPDAFVTATRQHVVAEQETSMEQLQLRFFLQPEASHSALKERIFTLTGVKVQGARVTDDGKLAVAEIGDKDLPRLLMCWTTEGQPANDQAVQLPMYLNAERKQILFLVSVPCTVHASRFYQNAAAFLASIF